MRRALVASLAALTIASLGTGAAHAAQLKGDYRFRGSHSPTFGPMPAMTDIGEGTNSFTSVDVGGRSRQMLHFPKDNGLSVSTAGVLPQDSYSVVMLFRLASSGADNEGSYRRLVDLKNAASDHGLYLHGGHLDFISSGADEGTGTVESDTFVQVALVRQDTELRVYLDGTLQFTDSGTGDDSTITADVLRFFRDDGSPDEETSAGEVSRIRLYSGALTPSEVGALDREPPDGDKDGVDDDLDNCPAAANPSQVNHDANAQGDACDTDDDNDGVADAQDTFPLDPSRYLKPATDGNDTISGSDRAETICGLLGNDSIFGLGGNDILYGDGCGVKSKLLVGAKKKPKGGKDKLYGGDGDDKLYGGPGKDVLDGGAGNDTLNGGSGKDTYKGGSGNDRISAADGKKEKVDCGKGKKDRATVDRKDKVKGCEKVKRKKK